MLTRDERLRVVGAPALHVRVTAARSPVEIFGYNVSVQLRQGVYLERGFSPIHGITWETGNAGIVRTRDFQSVIRNDVRDLVDEFINAYLSVQPHPTGNAGPTSTSPRRDLVRQVQQRLQTVGFNPGTIDGTLGPQTQQALRWFQNAQGLRSTGDLDEPTLNALGIR